MSSKSGRFNNKNWKFNKEHKPHSRKEYSCQDQLSEVDVGITEYLSDLEGFSAVIKARFSDFQVNEINLDGQIARLTDTKIPQDFKLEPPKCDYKQILESPIKYITQEEWENIKKVVEVENSNPILIDAGNFDRHARMEVHICVKSHFGRAIVASTVERDGKKFIEIKRFDKNGKKFI